MIRPFSSWANREMTPIPSSAGPILLVRGRDAQTRLRHFRSIGRNKPVLLPRIGNRPVASCKLRVVSAAWQHVGKKRSTVQFEPAMDPRASALANGPHCWGRRYSITNVLLIATFLSPGNRGFLGDR